MTNQPIEFYMLQMWMDTRHLANLGKMLHLPLRRVSNHYLVHCALNELFQDQAPKPFSLEDLQRDINKSHVPTQRHIPILGYSSVDADTLQELAKGFASPNVYHIIDWERLQSKPMPVEYPAGMQLGFELRACPVVRKASDGHKWTKGQEIDVYLSKVWEIDDESTPLEREDVYKDWLKKLLDKQAGAYLVSSQLERFSLERMSRRNHSKNRKVMVINRPDVLLSGKLEVRDSQAFKNLLRYGIGRHKSFGYGMLKIRRT